MTVSEDITSETASSRVPLTSSLAPENCTIKSVAKASTGGINGYITALGKTTRSDRSEFSFVNCTVDRTGKILLGRTWRAYASVVFSRTYMAGIIAPEGWNDWNNVTRDK
ncbi:unnamed protein product [Cochlearia groenlandica]